MYGLGKVRKIWIREEEEDMLGGKKRCGKVLWMGWGRCEEGLGKGRAEGDGRKRKECGKRHMVG